MRSTRAIIGRLAAALASVTTVPAAAQVGPAWVVQFGSSATDTAQALAPDGSGGVFVAGFAGSVGALDAWLARYDGAGERIWLRQFGTSHEDVALALAPDGSGGVFVAGWTKGAFGGPSAGESDAWLARYDSAGERIWLRQFGTSEYDSAEALAPDGSGGVFVAGSTEGDLGADAWLVRYDGAGERLWMDQFGAGEWDSAEALAPDGSGGVFVAGLTTGSLGGPHSGSTDIWLARYGREGDRLWIGQFGTSEWESAYALAPDGSGGVFIAGLTLGSLGGPSAGMADGWLARYDGAGDRLWMHQSGTSESDSADALAPDGSGGVFVAGSTLGSLGGPSAGARDAWLARYDGAGERIWRRQFGGSSIDYGRALAQDGSGGVFIAGDTYGEVGGPSAGLWDAWLARFPSGDTCYADCDGSGDLDFFDFLCFQNAFAAGDPYADCDGSGEFDFFDFLCFQNAFAAGCP